MAGRFKLDENLPRDAEQLLTSTGHDVESVLQEGLGGAPDARISEVCLRERRVLVTLDLDLADISIYPPAGTPGTWLLRPGLQSTPAIVSLLRRALSLLEQEPVEERLWVIEDQRVRIRE